MSADPRLAIFDLDGTLIEFHHEFLFAETQRVMKLLEHPLVDNLDLQTRFARFDYFSFIAPELRQQFIEQFWSMFDWRGFPKPRTISGVVETLEELVARGMSVAIATSRYVPPDSLREELKESGILNHVHLIVSRTGDHAHWTDKTGLLRNVLRAFEARPEEAMLVGDIPTDISSGRQVGIATNVAVRTGGIDELVLKCAQPDAIIENVPEILGILKRLG